MKIISAQSTSGDGPSGLADIVSQMDIAGRGAPDFIAIHFGVGLDAAELQVGAKNCIGSAALHGGSSCLGVMGPSGVDVSGSGLGAFAIWDGAGSYGTSSAELGDDAEAAARQAAEDALNRAGRPGEIPELIWLTVAPGREEDVINGLRAVVGQETLIVGGSAADNDVTGKWVQFGPDAVHSDGLVVSALFPSTPVASVYQSGYAPTGAHGVVTRVQGRRLHEIDGRAAAHVLHEWTSGAVPVAQDAPRSILADATLWPLGRVMRQVAGVPFHILAHPAVAHPDGAVDLFAAVSEGVRFGRCRGLLIVLSRVLGVWLPKHGKTRVATKLQVHLSSIAVGACWLSANAWKKYPLGLGQNWVTRLGWASSHLASRVSRPGERRNTVT